MREAWRHTGLQQGAAIPETRAEEKRPLLLTEPILAQIPQGAPGAGYWIAVGFLVFVTAPIVLVPLFRWLPSTLGVASIVPRHLSPPVVSAILWLTNLSLALPIPLHHWLRRRSMRSLGAPARGPRGWGFPYSEHPLARRHAIFCLLAPFAGLAGLGLMEMALRSPAGLLFIAVDWACFAPDAALAARLLREPGCTWVHFRRDGVVLYGVGRTPARQTPARLWLINLVIGAAQMMLLISVTSALPSGVPAPLRSPVFWLVGTVILAAARVRGARRRVEAEQRRRLEREADEARQMQRTLLPAATPALAGVQIAALFQPAHEVSGDFYLFPQAPAGGVRLVLGDVAGKGMPSALTAAMAVGFLRAGAEAGAGPAALLQAAGRSLRAARTSRTMVAACAAELEVGARRLRWCNAGLPPPALLQGSSLTWLPGAGFPLGSLPHPAYEEHEEPLVAGDLLLFYTDGLTEATSPLGDMFGRERLAAALGRLPGGCTAAEALEGLRREVNRFIGDREPYDDITVVALRLE